LVSPTAELCESTRHLNLGSNKLDALALAVLNQYLDKRIDHRWWQAAELSKRHINYGANDAWATLCIWQQAPTLQPADVTDRSDECDGGDSSGGASGSRDACTRHRGAGGPRTRAQAAADAATKAAIDDEVGCPLRGTSAANGDDGDEQDDNADDDDVVPSVERAAADTDAAASSMKHARQQIETYFHSTRQSDLELSSHFTSAQRKELHVFIDAYGLHHRSFGPPGHRFIVVSRWKPLTVVTAAIGQDAVGALVAKEVVQERTLPTGIVRLKHVERGSVAGFDCALTKWQLEYRDGSNETVDISTLNQRLNRRYQYAHGTSGLGEPGAQPARLGVGALDESELDELLSGIKPNWTRGRVKYDPRHWMANWAAMSAADKSSPLFRIFMAYTSEYVDRGSNEGPSLEPCPPCRSD